MRVSIAFGTPVLRILCIGLCAFAGASCSDSSTGTQESSLPASLILTADSTQVPAGSSIIITVKAADALGKPITSSGQTITWSVTGGIGTLSAPTSVTNSQGIATVTFTADTIAAKTGTIIAAEDGVQQVVSLSTTPNTTSVVTTASAQILGIAIVDTMLYFTAGPYQTGASVLGKAPANGGNATYISGVTGFNLPSGRIISDPQAGSIDLLENIGIISRTPIIVRVSLSDESTTNLYVSGREMWNAGPDLYFDGTYFYTAFFPHEDATGTGVVRIRATDDTVTKLVDHPSTTTQQSPFYIPTITVSGGEVYYTDSTAATGVTLQKISINGGASTTIATGIGPIRNPLSIDSTGNQLLSQWGKMLVIGNTIYWAEAGDNSATAGTIRSAPISGGPVTTQVSGLSPRVSNMVTDGTSLYVNDGGSLRRFRLSDFSVTTIAANDNVGDIALTEHSVYWSSAQKVKKALK